VSDVFTVDCPTHGTRVLLTARSVTGVRNLPAGIELDWRCHCGARGTLRFDGRHAPLRDGRSDRAATPVAA
jgi:hypothetical protein